MNALPNADNRRGGKNPSSVGLASNTSPEVQGLKTENSHTGGGPRIVCQTERSNGSFCVQLMVEQKKPLNILKPRM